MLGAASVEFGGPDLAPRRLRDLLQRHVDAAPPGSRIDWATYYFRDRALADALIRASDRGVAVRLALDAAPRRRGANDAVIAMLGAHGLGGGLGLYGGGLLPGRLHAKIYAFSHPDRAYVGSFNPSGDVPEDRDAVAEIGDQDRGHNLLVAVAAPANVAALRAHVGRLCAGPRLLDRLSPSFNRAVGPASERLYFYPRLRTRPVEAEIDRLGAGDSLRGAISHLKAGSFTAAATRAAARGADVRLLVHDTERRVPQTLIGDLAGRGVAVRRVRDPDGLPMHAKFVLLERKGEACAWVGSYNFNPRSRFINAEVLLRATDPALLAALGGRFAEIAAGAIGGGAGAGHPLEKGDRPAEGTDAWPSA